MRRDSSSIVQEATLGSVNAQNSIARWVQNDVQPARCLIPPASTPSALSKVECASWRVRVDVSTSLHQSRPRLAQHAAAAETPARPLPSVYPLFAAVGAGVSFMAYSSGRHFLVSRARMFLTTGRPSAVPATCLPSDLPTRRCCAASLPRSPPPCLRSLPNLRPRTRPHFCSLLPLLIAADQP